MCKKFFAWLEYGSEINRIFGEKFSDIQGKKSDGCVHNMHI